MLRGATQTVRWPQPDANALLQRHAPLRALVGPEWDAALADATVLRSTSAHTPVFEGCNGDYFGIVLEGTIRVRSLAPDGRTLSICRVQAGELCVQSLTAIYSDHSAVVDLTSEGKFVALQIPANHLPILLSASEAFRSFMLASMSRHVMTLLGRIEETSFGCMKSRILGHLRDMSEANGCSVIAVSHQELAEELGATREAVSRTLKQMERSGNVRLGRRSISLLAVSPVVSAPAPRDGSPSAMETRRLRESFDPKLVPQRKQLDPRPRSVHRRADRSDDVSGPVQPSTAGRLSRAGTLAPKRTVFRSL